MPTAYGIDSTMWSIIIDVISRRSARMIPWRTGQRGTWSLNDRFEEIYMDHFSLEKVNELPLKMADNRLNGTVAELLNSTLS